MKIAFPRSSYHLKLLSNNNFKGDYVLTRKLKEVENNKSIYVVGEEAPFNYKKNIGIYRRLKGIICRRELESVIIFDAEKPINKFVIDVCLKKNISVELWEDGLFYYMPIMPSFKLYFFKSLVKLVSGYYPKGFMSLTYRKNKLIHKDRFKNKNLICENIANIDAARHSRGLFISQPLVKDGYCSLDTYLYALLKIKDKYGDLCYYPHPREDKRTIDEALKMGFVLIENNDGFETYDKENIHPLYISPFSTALLNVSSDGMKIFCPSYFKLSRIEKKLRKLSFINVAVV